MASNAYIVKLCDKNDMAFRNGYKVYLVSNRDAADIWILPYDSPDCRGASYEIEVAIVDYPSEAQKSAYVCTWVEYSWFKEQLAKGSSGSSSGNGSGYFYSDDSSYSSSSSARYTTSSGTTKNAVIGIIVISAIVLAIAGGIFAYVNWEKERTRRALLPTYSSLSIDCNLGDSSTWFKAYYKDDNEEITNFEEILNKKEIVVEPIQKDNYVFFDWYDNKGYRMSNFDTSVYETNLNLKFPSEGTYNYKMMMCKINSINPQYATGFYTTGESGTGFSSYRILAVKCNLTEDGEYYGYLDTDGKAYTKTLFTSSDTGVQKINSFSNEVPSYTVILQPRNGHKVSFKSFSSSNGAVTCYPEKYNTGDTVTLSFKEKNKEFNGYYIDGELLSLDKDYQFAMPDKDVQIEIKFK